MTTKKIINLLKVVEEITKEEVYFQFHSDYSGRISNLYTDEIIIYKDVDFIWDNEEEFKDLTEFIYHQRKLNEINSRKWKSS